VGRIKYTLVAGLVLALLVVPATSSLAAPAFSDGFESGNLVNWTKVTGNVTVQSIDPAPNSGSFYARAISTGSAAYIKKTLSSPLSDVYVQAAVNIVFNGGTNLILIRLKDSSGASVVSLKVKTAGFLRVANNIAGTTKTSATPLPGGSWHLLQLHARMGSSSLIEVWLDGTQVIDLTMTDPLGTATIGSIQLGHSGTSSGFTVGLDDAVIDTSFIGAPPPVSDTPTNLHQVSVTSTTASIAWDAVSNAAGYGVYRDGIHLIDMSQPSFNDLGLHPSATYTYAVDAFNTSGRSAQTAPLSVTTAASAGVLVRAAGDIACDPNDTYFAGTNANRCQQRATANLLNGADVVFAVGDTQYSCGGTQAYQQSYDSSWGAYKSQTFAAAGDHEYATSATEPNGTDCSTNPDAAGYYGYFGNRGGSTLATPLPSVSQSNIPGVYSLNLPLGCTPVVQGNCTWHVVVLNSVCTAIGGCVAGSPMEQWLQQDLNANSWAGCSLALLHVPRFASKASGSNLTNDKHKTLWEDFVSGGVELVLSGNSHFYERFTPQDADGNYDPNGTVQWIVGTGGRSHGTIAAPGSRLPNSQAGQSDTFGVLELTLKSGSYDWSFLPVPGDTFSDTGSLNCT
jgi:hypothetical protein